jgi:uncharacterized protein
VEKVEAGCLGKALVWEARLQVEMAGREAVPKTRFGVSGPITCRAIGSGKYLFLQAHSGSWIIVENHSVQDVQALLEAASSRLLDRFPDALETPLVAELYRAGLLSVNGRNAWDHVDFENETSRINTLILKMAGYCNIACTYCYDFEAATYKNRLTVEQGKKAIRGTLENVGPRLNILFHGGEPLLAYDAITDLVAYAQVEAQKTGTELLLSIQTNGTRFTPEIVKFLIKNRFSVGVSLDGPKLVNDSFRVDFKGRGTWQNITEAISEFPELASQMGVLTTVTNANAARLKEVACHFRDWGVRCWDVTVFQAAGRATKKPSRFAPDLDELITSYMDLLDGVEADEFGDMEIRPVLHYVRNVLGYERPNMCLRNGCGAAKELVSVSADGTVEACDCISEPALSLGNLAEGGISGALSSAQAQNIRSRTVRNLTPCTTCDWRTFCGGTCLAKTGEVTKVDTGECAVSMALFPDILRRLANSDRLFRYAERFGDPLAH